MYCSNCGKELKKDAVFCTECGKKVSVSKVEEVKNQESNVQTTVVTNIPESNSKGVASLVLGIISLFFGFFLVPLPIVGLILGIVQKKKNGIAIAGIIINIIALIGIIITWLLVIALTINSKTVDNDDYYYHDTVERDNDFDSKLNDYFEANF